MPVSSAMPVPAGEKRAGLVAVDGRTYPLESVRVAARAEGGVAFTTLTQVYRNPYAEPLEVTYTLPLPADGAVVGYAIRIGDRVIRGEVRRREEAAAAYRKALFEGKTASLLEQDRDDTFTQRLGALPAGVSADVTIEVLQPLAFLAGAEAEAPLWEYRFPTVAGVRYEGGPGRVSDAERLDVDRAGTAGAIPTRCELELTVPNAGPRALVMTSPSHALVLETGAEATIVRLAESARLDRDLVVRWSACSADVGVRLVEGPGLPGDDGRYALVTVTPPAAPATAFSRDLAILIDASGSMSGEPIAWAREVACGLIKSLGAGDRFSVTAFASRPQPLTHGVIEASERNIARAVETIRALEAGGGTEMTRALVEALSPLRSDAQRQVVLISDGYIGFEREVVAEVLRRLPDGSRLHVVGVGAAPNRTLTVGASRAGRGVEAFVCGDDEVEPATRRLVRATSLPVLTEVTVQGSAVIGSAPCRPRDVFAGQPLVLAAELRPEGGTIEVRGRIPGEVARWSWSNVVPAASSRFAAATTVAVGALFGRETVADLEMVRAIDEDPEAHDTLIEATALRHRIASRLTSLVAVSDEPTVDPKGPRRSETLPVEMPAYVSAEGAGLAEMSRVAFGTRARDAVFDLMPLEGEELGEEYRLVAPRGRIKALTGRIREELRRLTAPEIPTRLDLGEAQVLHVDGARIVIEFRVPDGGFVVPEGRVTVEISGRPAIEGRIDPTGSTPHGPCPGGTMVRVAIELDEGQAWPAGAKVTLTWKEPAPAGMKASGASVAVSLTVPAAPEGGPEGRRA